MALVVKSSIRGLKILKNFRISDEFFEKLDKEIEELVKKAVERAKARKEKTLKAYHL